MLAIVDFQSQLFLMNVAVLDLITRQLLAFQVTTIHKGNKKGNNPTSMILKSLPEIDYCLSQ